MSENVLFWKGALTLSGVKEGRRQREVGAGSAQADLENLVMNICKSEKVTSYTIRLLEHSCWHRVMEMESR